MVPHFPQRDGQVVFDFCVRQDGRNPLVILKIRNLFDVFFSKLSSETFVTSENLSPFIFGGMQKSRFG